MELKGVSIDGIAARVPATVVKSAESGEALFGKETERAVKVIGAEERRLFKEGEGTSLDLCVGAARDLASYAGFDYSGFGALVFVTMTPDFLMPNDASYAHKLLGFAPQTPAFDINLACSGYPYGLWVAGMIAASSGRRVLLLDGDTHSPFISPHDRATALLFGDGGTATAVAPREGAAPWHFDFVTIGDRDSLVVPDGGYRNRVNEASLTYEDFPDGSRRRRIDLKMDGMAVFNSVVRNAPASLSRAMEAAGSGEADYDFLVLHQANLMMINQVAKKLGFAGARFPTSISKYGNVGSASIPLTICSELKETVEARASRVLVSAFGAGFSVASASLEIGPCPCAGVKNQ